MQGVELLSRGVGVCVATTTSSVECMADLEQAVECRAIGEVVDNDR